MAVFQMGISAVTMSQLVSLSPSAPKHDLGRSHFDAFWAYLMSQVFLGQPLLLFRGMMRFPLPCL